MFLVVYTCLHCLPTLFLDNVERIRSTREISNFCPRRLQTEYTYLPTIQAPELFHRVAPYSSDCTVRSLLPSPPDSAEHPLIPGRTTQQKLSISVDVLSRAFTEGEKPFQDSTKARQGSVGGRIRWSQTPYKIEQQNSGLSSHKHRRNKHPAESELSASLSSQTRKNELQMGLPMAKRRPAREAPGQSSQEMLRRSGEGSQGRWRS